MVAFPDMPRAKPVLPTYADPQLTRCLGCGVWFVRGRRDQFLCDDACRKRWKRGVVPDYAGLYRTNAETDPNQSQEEPHGDQA